MVQRSFYTKLELISSKLITIPRVLFSLVSSIKHPSNTHIIPVTVVFLSIIMLLDLGGYVLHPSYSEIISYGNNGTALSRCNCVVFRMDDIQDYFVRSAQLAIM